MEHGGPIRSQMGRFAHNGSRRSQWVTSLTVGHVDHNGSLRSQWVTSLTMGHFAQNGSLRSDDCRTSCVVQSDTIEASGLHSNRTCTVSIWKCRSRERAPRGGTVRSAVGHFDTARVQRKAQRGIQCKPYVLLVPVKHRTRRIENAFILSRVLVAMFQLL